MVHPLGEPQTFFLGSFAPTILQSYRTSKSIQTTTRTFFKSAYHTSPLQEVTQFCLGLSPGTAINLFVFGANQQVFVIMSQV